MGKTVRRENVETKTYVGWAGPTLVMLTSCGHSGGEDCDDITAKAAQEAGKAEAATVRHRRVNGARRLASRFRMWATTLPQYPSAGQRPRGAARHAFEARCADGGDCPSGHGQGVVLTASRASKIPPDIAKTLFIAGDQLVRAESSGWTCL